MLPSNPGAVRMVDHPYRGEVGRAVVGKGAHPRYPLHRSPWHHVKVGGRSQVQNRQTVSCELNIVNLCSTHHMYYPSPREQGP